MFGKASRAALFVGLFFFVHVKENHCDITGAVVVNTWGFTNATDAAWQELETSRDRLDSLVAGCGECEEQRCDGTVGWGGSPDEHGLSTLDALILDGKSGGAGSVASLKRIKNAIGVARAVMDHTEHTLLVGEAADRFALDMGFHQNDLHSVASAQKWADWKRNACQPNFWKNVVPDPKTSCGPYSKPSFGKQISNLYTRERQRGGHQSEGHDTIGMIVRDADGNFAAGTSTNGATHKIAGRVGDSPIIGSGAFVDNDVGAACATGDGDTMMRYLPSYQAVESMRLDMSPRAAALDAIQRIVRRQAKFAGAVVAIDRFGNHGAACHGMPFFPYSYRHAKINATIVAKIRCI